MRERGQDVRIPVDIAANLVAGHVNTLWSQVVNDEDMRGCCKICCFPCRALHQLLELGLLDDLYEAYHRATGGQSDVWDDARGEIDRAWLANAWRDDLGCHEMHLDRRACQNDRDHAGGDWCPGWLVFEPGEPQAACDTCGAWCGVLANGDPACPRQDGWRPKESAGNA